MDPRQPYSDWYDQRTAAPPQPQSPKKQRRSGVKIALFSLLALVLVVGAVLASARVRLYTAQTRTQVRTSPTLPSATPFAGEFGDDFREFFENYYAAEESSYTGSRLERTRGDMSAAVEIVSAAGRGEMPLQELYRRSVGSIVGIEAYEGASAGYAWGTGIVMSPDGYIVTNEHIIDGCERAVAVLPDGRKMDALLVGEDVLTDLAVLKIDASGLSPAEFGDSGALCVGDRVAAIGNPLGDSLSGTMTDGIISAIDRDVQLNGRRMTLIQTDAALNEGNSGGPLLNLYGQVVGITNMKMVNRYSDVTIEGIGFAIPSATVKAVTDQLISKGEVSGRPGLGITVGSVPAAAAERYDLPEGLYVSTVSARSDAAAKDVRVGDILTHVNGEAVRSTGDVLAQRDQCAVGDTMVLTLWREGSSFDVEITLMELGALY